jgi:hypothetical protein
MTITAMLDKMIEEADEVGDCVLKIWKRRKLSRYVTGNWLTLFHSARFNEELELFPDDVRDLAEHVRCNLAASIAAKLTA